MSPTLTNSKPWAGTRPHPPGDPRLCGHPRSGEAQTGRIESVAWRKGDLASGSRRDAVSTPRRSAVVLDDTAQSSRESGARSSAVPGARDSGDSDPHRKCGRHGGFLLETLWRRRIRSAGEGGAPDSAGVSSRSRRTRAARMADSTGSASRSEVSPSIPRGVSCEPGESSRMTMAHQVRCISATRIVFRSAGRIIQRRSSGADISIHLTSAPEKRESAA
jgi:hypothetical protein